MNKKITCSFAAAALTLSALMGAPAHAVTPGTIQATTEEMTIPDAQGFTVLNKESIVFSGCTADNHRITSQFFLAVDVVTKDRISKPLPSVTAFINFVNSGFEQFYKQGAETVTAREVAEDIKQKTVPLEIRQHMNAMRRVAAAKEGNANFSWRLKDTTISAKRDPSCNVQPE